MATSYQKQKVGTRHTWCLSLALTTTGAITRPGLVLCVLKRDTKVYAVMHHRVMLGWLGLEGALDQLSFTAIPKQYTRTIAQMHHVYGSYVDLSVVSWAEHRDKAGKHTRLQQWWG